MSNNQENDNTSVLAEKDSQKGQSKHFSEGEIVEISIEGHIFRLHEELLKEKVPYFRASLSSTWRRKRKGPIKLPGVDVEAFRNTLSWIYSGTLPDGITRLIGLDNDDDETDIYDALEELYKVADRLVMSDLQNAIIDLLANHRKESGTYATLLDLMILFDLDLTHTPLYQFQMKNMVKAFVLGEDLEVDHPLDGIKGCPRALVNEIMLSLASYYQTPWDLPENGDLCEFHIHENGVKCPKAQP